jgi:hypothetical protein
MTYLEQLSQAVMDSILPGLVGLYLHGSLALDDFVAGKNDVDLCVVVPDLHDDQRQRLVGALSPDTMPLEGGGFDIHVVTLYTVRTPGWTPVREIWVAVHPGWEFHVEGRAADHDMCLTLEMCRRHGRALYGPDAKEVFAPADRAALLAACKREIEKWLSYEPIRQWDSAVLSACRAWWLVGEDELGSKTSAGRWALSKGFPVVERAVAHRTGDRVAVPDQSAVRELLLHVHTLLEYNLAASVVPGP